jgi:hypothetical protein
MDPAPIHWTGSRVASRVDLDAVEKKTKKISYPCRELNPNSSPIQPAERYFTD